MKAKTELLLYRLLWLAEKPLRPTFQNIESSFMGWAYHAGLRQQIERLEAQGFLECKRDPATGERLHRLTSAGRRAVSGGRDPVAAWAMKWDRKWRLFLFDVPEHESAKRRKLTRALASAGCGCLQGSVWIAPSTLPSVEIMMHEEDEECSRLLLLCAESKGEVVDGKMVLTAWDFEAINDRYRELDAILDRFAMVAMKPTKEDLDDWTAAEMAASRAALALDPLLPSELLPPGYLGRKVWARRLSVLGEVARLTPTAEL